MRTSRSPPVATEDSLYEGQTNRSLKFEQSSSSRHVEDLLQNGQGKAFPSVSTYRYLFPPIHPFILRL
jgi:hypothetical protein